MKVLSAGAIWQGLTDSLKRDFAMLFAVAAPFTLLVDMVLALFGPPPPASMAEFTPDRAMLLMLVPTLIGSIAQLALARLIARPGETPRRALGIGFGTMPAYVAAVLVSAIPTGLGLILLVVPGLYILARLFVTAPVAALEGLGPLAILRRSWDLTAGNAGC